MGGWSPGTAGQPCPPASYSIPATPARGSLCSPSTAPAPPGLRPPLAAPRAPHPPGSPARRNGRDGLSEGRVHQASGTAGTHGFPPPEQPRAVNAHGLTPNNSLPPQRSRKITHTQKPCRVEETPAHLRKDAGHDGRPRCARCDGVRRVRGLDPADGAHRDGDGLRPARRSMKGVRQRGPDPTNGGRRGGDRLQQASACEEA